MISVFIISSLLGTILAQEFRSDYNYDDQAQGWLKFHSIPSNWNDARLRCHLEGAVLASPLNNNLTLAMLSMMKSKSIAIIYTGINAFFSKGDYSSLEGVPLSAIPTQGYPVKDNLDDEESCIAMRDFGNIFDVKCQNPYRYICYKKYDQSMTTNLECGTTDHSYQYVTETGSCYKIHREPRTWSRAYMTCMAEGGHLAIINSEKEAQALVAILNKVARSKSEIFAHIGFQDWGEHGTWLTIHGETLQEAGYNTWNVNEPSNRTDSAGSGEYCGSIVMSNAKFNDVHCYSPLDFICEKDPRSLTTRINL